MVLFRGVESRSNLCQFTAVELTACVVGVPSVVTGVLALWSEFLGSLCYPICTGVGVVCPLGRTASTPSPPSFQNIPPVTIWPPVGYQIQLGVPVLYDVTG